jgi:hypothetical protein
MRAQSISESTEGSVNTSPPESFSTGAETTSDSRSITVRTAANRSATGRPGRSGLCDPGADSGGNPRQ